MAYSLRLNAACLRLWLVVSVCVKQHACQTSSQCTLSDECSTFRVFYGDDQRHLDTLSSLELLRYAAKSGESYVVGMSTSRESQTAISQEGVNLNIYCSRWLNRSHYGVIKWYFIQLDDFLNPSATPQLLLPTESEVRITVGGDFNEWLNISSVVIQGAEDPDSKIFMCEVCTNQSAPLQQCYTSNFTLRVIGAPPVISNPPTSTNLIQLSRNSTYTLELNCTVNFNPSPWPTPTRSWFRNGELVYTTNIGSPVDDSEFLMNYTILMLGVLDPVVFSAASDGGLFFNTEVNNITVPSLVPDVTTVFEAREQVYDILFGNWTCMISNDLGSSSIEYIITDEQYDQIPSEIRIEVGWLRDSFTGREDVEYDILGVGVISGAEFLQDNFTFMVDFCQENNGSADLTIHTPLVHLSPPFTPQEVLVTFNNDGVTLEGNETYQLCLFPLVPMESEVNFRQNITLIIQDSDVFSLTWTTFGTVPLFNETAGNVTVFRIKKNKAIAKCLPVFVDTLTHLEYTLQQNRFYLKPDFSEAKPDADFTTKSYFRDFVYFEADEGKTLVNELNISIEIIDDEVFEERERFAVVFEVSTPSYCIQLSTEIYIYENDGCPADTVDLPAIGEVTFPISKPGEYAEPFPCQGMPNLFVKRFCGMDKQWSEPHYLQCSEAIIEQNITALTKKINQLMSLNADEAQLLIAALSQIRRDSNEIGTGESNESLNAIDQTLAVIAKFAESAVTEEVVNYVVSVLGDLSTWPESVVQQRSSNIVMSFEAIATNLTEQLNFTSQNFTGEKVIFIAERRDVEDLAEYGTAVKFNTKAGVGPGDSLESDDDISSVSLPPSLFENLRMKSSADNVGLVFTSYSNDILFPLALNTSDTFIGSSVLGVTVVSDQPVQNLKEPVVIKFKVDNLKNALSVECVSWDFGAAGGRGNWTATGCKTSQSGDKFVECRCNHLTNFAILMQICTRTGGCDFDPIILDTVSTICVYISICCLFITVVTLAGLIVTKGRSLKERERESAVQYKFYIQLCIALLCMYIVFIVGIDRTEHYGGCVIVSVLIHYFTLVAVMWMTATCMFLFWIMVVNPFAKSKFNSYHMLLITALCWVVPVIPVIIPVAIDRDLTLAYSDEEEPKIQFCFINDKYVFFIAFLAPLLILILMNLVMYISITFVQLRYICCTRRQRRAGNETTWKSKFREDCITALKLWCILSLFGLTWLFGAFTITQESAFIFSTLFAIFTSLQGFFIFVFLCILSRDALKCYKSVFCKRSESDLSSDLQSPATSHYSKSSSLSSKESNRSYNKVSEVTKSALTKELLTKVKFYEQESDLIKTSTFKPEEKK